MMIYVMHPCVRTAPHCSRIANYLNGSDQDSLFSDLELLCVTLQSCTNTRLRSPGLSFLDQSSGESPHQEANPTQDAGFLASILSAVWITSYANQHAILRPGRTEYHLKAALRTFLAAARNLALTRGSR